VLAFEADSIRLAITATNGEKIGYKKLPRVRQIALKYLRHIAIQATATHHALWVLVMLLILAGSAALFKGKADRRSRSRVDGNSPR
jgi:hypothetical protein